MATKHFTELIICSDIRLIWSLGYSTFVAYLSFSKIFDIMLTNENFCSWCLYDVFPKCKKWLKNDFTHWGLMVNPLVQAYPAIFRTIENLSCMKKIICQIVWLERMKVNLVIFNVQFIFSLINETDTRTF